MASAEASAQATTRQELVQRFEVRGTTGAAFLATYTSYVLDHERTLAQQLLATPTVSDAQFASFLNIFGFGSAVLLDGEGRDLDVVPYDASIIGTDLAGHYAHLASAVAGRPAVSNVVASAAQHVPIVAFATPFATAYGRRVVSGAFDLTAEPMGLYLQHVLPYADGATFLVDGSDQVIASSTRQAGPLASIDGPLARAVTNTRSFGYYRPAAGGDAVYATARIAGTPWKLVLSVPSATLFAPISETARLLPWLLLVAFAIAGTGLLLLLARTRQARVAADRAARTDLLTAVPNRRAAFESLTRLVADRSRYGHSLGVLLIDVDHFKDINDALG
ncbi:MAG TPA: diguanylate cyclase, partial [Acidimicrobiales bacterium]|nr:diguanylate cyclase [Acidimicrobiales bacterium]